MSMAYCFDCLEPVHICGCGNSSGREIFGDIRVGIARDRKKLIKKIKQDNLSIDEVLELLNEDI